MNYVLHILIMCCLYAMLALSLNLVLGYAGLLSLCHAAFYGIGAYATALLMLRWGLSFFIAIPAAMVVAFLLALVVGFPSLRLRGDYFVLASLGFQVIIYTILYNWTGLTGGPNGIPGIPRPRMLGFEVRSVGAFCVLALAITFIVTLALWMIVNSPFGRALKAIREDEVAAAALGKNVPRLKTLAFCLAGAFAAVPGGLFATYMRYIDPTSFDLMAAVFVVVVVILGGAGNTIGPLVGSAFMVILPEALRFLNLPDALAANSRQIIYGVLLIVLMRFRPQGALGEYRLE